MPRRNTGPRIKWRDEKQWYEIQEFESGKRKRLVTGITCIRDAEIQLAEILGQKRRLDGTRPLNKRLIDDVLADYALEHACLTQSATTIAHHIDNLSRFWCQKYPTCDKIKKSTCQEYITHRHYEAGRSGKNFTDATGRRELETLQAALNHDVREERIPYAPNISFPNKADPKQDWLTRSELARLIWAARQESQSKWHLTWFIVLSYYSGQRKEAVLSHTWDQIDLKGGIIDWQPAGRAQTNKRRPKQPMDCRIRLFYKLLARRGTDNGYVLHRNQKQIKDIKKSFAGAVRRAGLRHMTPHILRHTAITHTLQGGVSIWETAGFFGVSAKTIEAVYGHHASGYMNNAKTARTRKTRSGQ